MLYPEQILEKLGFDEIKLKIKQECLSAMGVEMVERMKFISNFDLLQKLLLQTKEFKQLLNSGDYFPSTNFLDLKSIVSRIRVEGTYLTEEDFHQVSLTLHTVFACIDYFKIREGIYPNLELLVNNLEIDRKLIKSIENVIDPKGKIKTNASKELAAIYADISHTEAEARKKINQLFKELQKDGFAAEGQLTVRDGRLAIPLLAEYKRKIKGLILDESATGQTVFMEPAEVFELNNKVRDLEYAKRREIIKILIELTDQLRPFLPILLSYHQLITIIDFIRAKAKFANSIDAEMPILLKEPILKICNARHPLLTLAFKQLSKKVIPLNVDLTEENYILLISGPNAGGKSVALKTVGLLQVMLQFGLLVPAASHSEFGIMKKIFVDIGDDQSIDSDLSTYSAHLSHMKYFVEHANSQTLVLIDEFGTGTDPKFGGPIAEAVLETLNKKKVRGVLTTHYSNLKIFANSTNGIQNASMLFDNIEMLPFYKLEIGQPGSSYAFEIAQKIGLPANVLNLAKQKVGHQQKKVDSLLADLERDKKIVEDKKIALESLTSKANLLIQENKNAKDYLDENKKKLLKEAKQVAEQLIKSANKLVENTIAEIKEVKAEKIATQAIRKGFEKIAKEILQEELPKKQSTALQKSETKIAEGTWVQFEEKNLEAEVLRIQKGKAELALGDITIWVPLEKLQSIKKPIKKNNSISSFSSLLISNVNDFQPQIDLRGARADEALFEVEKFLDKAIMLNHYTLRILHGKGDGILRKLIRANLQKYDIVESITSEKVEFGGDGITIVQLK